MKDFTKTQKDTKAVSLKCNTCSTVVKAFGVEPGDPCSGNSKLGADLGKSAPIASCSGKYLPFDGRTADQLKRRSDGSS